MSGEGTSSAESLALRSRSVTRPDATKAKPKRQPGAPRRVAGLTPVSSSEDVVGDELVEVSGAVCGLLESTRRPSITSENGEDDLGFDSEDISEALSFHSATVVDSGDDDCNIGDAEYNGLTIENMRSLTITIK